MSNPSKPFRTDLLATVTRRDVDAEQLRRSFARFVARYFEPMTGVPFVPNIATTAVIAVLQGVADDRLHGRVLLALSPGTGKSTLLALFAAFRLARDPAHRAIHAGHSYSLAATESRRVRRLIEGDEYRSMFPAVELRTDESTVEHWATSKDGRYFAVGTDSGLLGRRAREAVLDDPLNVTDRFSKAARESLWTWFQESLSTRLDGDRAPIIVCSQRIDRDDLIGRLLESGEPCTLLELAAEYDSTRHCTVLASDGSVVWTDPRTVDGELLAPNVLPREKLDALKGQIGSAAYACMYLQRPSDDANATIKRTWWRFHRAAHVAEQTPRPSGCETDTPAVATPDRFDRIVIAADLTFGSTKGDFAVAQCWAAVAAGRYLLAQWRKRAGMLESAAAIKAMRADYPSAKVIIEKAANGAGCAEELAAAGVHGVVLVPPLGSKAERIGMVSATIEAGNCLLPLGASWLGDFVEELAGSSRHDDAQDCAAYAIHELNAAGADTVALLLAAFGPRQPEDRGRGAAESAAENQAARDRRRALLERLAAKEASGAKLSRGERLHLRMWRRKPERTA